MNITTIEQNPIIHSFLSISSHKQLLEQAMYYPTERNKQTLNQAFQLFFLEARFTSYIASLIHFSAINYDKKIVFIKIDISLLWIKVKIKIIPILQSSLLRQIHIIL